MKNEVKDWETYARAFREIRPSSPEFLRTTLECIAEVGCFDKFTIPGAPWIDIGAGAGRLSGALADFVDRTVIACEQQTAMLGERRRVHPRVRWVQADALAPPFRQRAASGILLHSVLHQMADWKKGIQVLAPVLKPGGVLAIRTMSTDHLAGTPIAKAFHGLVDIHRSRFPAIDAIVETLRDCGFSVRSREFEKVHQLPREAYFYAIESKSWSSLRLLSDQEFKSGLARLHEAYPESTGQVPYADHSVVIVGRC